jgi:O-antigen/teichoic acid export membrane protein
MEALAQPPKKAPDESGVRHRRVASASVWTVGSMGAMSLLRLGSQMVLTYLLLPQHFGAIALMRVFLVFLEMVSDVGIRGSVVYHQKGENRDFLNTAWTLQILRGGCMWLAACALAWPVATFYDQPLLLWLLPVAGLEAINNGFLSVRIFTKERNLSLKLPVLLDWIGLAVSILTTVVWALLEPSVWALAAGPLVGGLCKTLASHRLIGGERLCFGWNREHVRSLFDFGKWVIGGTIVSFLAQQFHVLYLAKFLPLAILGVYQVAWNFCVQASKPLTVLSNRVIIPHFAEFGRQGVAEHSEAVGRALGRFLPACLLICVCTGLACPALFGFFYEQSFVEGGTMGRLLSCAVWFMVLQHVPRSALLSIGVSRKVASMALVNAIFTVGGIVSGYILTKGSVPGAILGNALGNVAGCTWGVLTARRVGLRVGRAMLCYSLWFLALSLLGYAMAQMLVGELGWTEALASAVVTLVFGVPLSILVWIRVGRTLLSKRKPV